MRIDNKYILPGCESMQEESIQEDSVQDGSIEEGTEDQVSSSGGIFHRRWL